MKTVLDAVIEYKAEWPPEQYAQNNSQIIMAVKDFGVYKSGQLTIGDGVRNNEFWHVVCDEEQFTQHVNQLSAGES